MQKIGLLLLVLICGVANAQQQHLNRYAFENYEQVKVMANGDSLINAWAGGFNFTQFNTIDLNADGIEDLLVFDRSGNRLVPFIVEQNAGVMRYKFAPGYVDSFPEIQHWLIVADYDCDGLKDLFVAVNGGIGVYRQTSHLKFQWALSGRDLKSDYGNGVKQRLYVSNVDMPAIVDVDNDGDLDIFTFGLGNTVEHHEGQTPCDIDFKIKFYCWGGFEEDGFTNSVKLDQCNGFKRNPDETINTDLTGIEQVQHSGSTITLIDLDSNNLYDALIGDISFSNTVTVFNDGTPDSAHMYAQDSLWPLYDQSIDLTFYPGFYYLDVDFDGVKDLIATPSIQGSENYLNTWFYKNNRTTEYPDFNFQDSSFLQNQMIEVGEGARPVFVDLNFDQLPDLIVCNSGFFDKQNGGYISKASYYKNIGTANAPKFELVDDDFANLSTQNLGRDLHLTFGDLDGDFDQDMIVGDLNGNLHYFENQGLLPNYDFVLTKPNLSGINVGSFATPFLYDMNEDGDLDLIIGNSYGNLHYYENDGGSNLSFSLVSDDFGGINTHSFYTTSGYSVPFLFRDSSKTVLMVGTYDRGIIQYDSLDNVLVKPSTIEATIGTGNISTTDHLVTPFGTSKKAGRNQILIKSSELIANGLEYGKIKKISLNLTSNNNPIIGYGKLSISMKLVNKDSLVSFEDEGQLTYNEITPVSTGWLNLTLTTPFLWDGESDLLIEFCFSKQADNAKDIAVACTNVGFKSNAYGDGTGSTNQTVGCNLAYDNSSFLRPNVKLTLQPTAYEVGTVAKDGERNAPAIANLDGDAYPDMIVGLYGGGLRYFKGTKFDFPNISITENKLIPGFKVYPNPASHKITLAWDAESNEHVDVLIYDLNGRLLINTSIENRQSISTEHLPSGMYIIHAKTSNKFVASGKLIIIND